MKGAFSVASKPLTTTTTTSTTPATTTTGDGAGHDLDVSMTEYAFELAVNGAPVTSVPQGTITFVIKNNGQEVHNFDIGGVNAGALISPGQSDTWTVGLATKAAGYPFQCDVPFHADRGMVGLLNVT